MIYQSDKHLKVLSIPIETGASDTRIRSYQKFLRKIAKTAPVEVEAQRVFKDVVTLLKPARILRAYGDMP